MEDRIERSANDVTDAALRTTQPIGYTARVVLDSVSPAGVRLTTIEATLPRFVLAEMNTHRMLSKNSASSRAVPTQKFLARATEAPVVPIEWGLNMRGMSANESLPTDIAAQCEAIWLEARDDMIRHASRLAALNVHKQVVNRILEPFLWHTMVITGTEWANFFAQRLSADAQPEIRHGARLIREAFVVSTPHELAAGDWHLPFIAEDERSLTLDLRKKLSVARCARTSYLSQNGKRETHLDVELYERLVRGNHWSPFEHQAQSTGPTDGDEIWSGNLRGWIQLRKAFSNENVTEFPEVA